MKEGTLFGESLIFTGNQYKVGDISSDLTALDQKLKPLKLSDFEGKIRLISSTPSLDTPVCDFQLRTFNQRAFELPFTTGRLCASAGIERIKDHKEASSGLNTAGVLYEDREVVVDGKFITSRMPSDLPFFVRELLRAVEN